MRTIGLAAAAAAIALAGAAVAQPPAARTVDPKCPPGGCSIPVPYPVKPRAAPPTTPTPASTDDIKPSVGDEAGSPSGHPHKAVGQPIKFEHRGVNPNPTPPRNPNSPIAPR